MTMNLLDLFEIFSPFAYDLFFRRAHRSDQEHAPTVSGPS